MAVQVHLHGEVLDLGPRVEDAAQRLHDLLGHVDLRRAGLHHVPLRDEVRQTAQVILVPVRDEDGLVAQLPRRPGGHVEHEPQLGHHEAGTNPAAGHPAQGQAVNVELVVPLIHAVIDVR